MFDLFDLDDNGLIDLYDLRLLLADTQQKYVTRTRAREREREGERERERDPNPNCTRA